MTLFDWNPTPAPVVQGPPRPSKITVAQATGLQLVDVSKDNGWSDDWAVRCTATNAMCRLAHVATWGDFHGKEIYLTDAQNQTVQTWKARLA